MTTHLYAEPGQFPDTRCGLSAAWGRPVSAVYSRDFHLVTCPDCLAALRMPPRDITVDKRHRDRDVVYILCWIATFTLIVLVGLWWLL